jgi:hypothetical protein
LLNQAGFTAYTFPAKIVNKKIALSGMFQFKGLVPEQAILYAVDQSPGRFGSPENHPDYIFFCPGCRFGHAVFTTKRNCRGAQWTFNGNMERPTFSPSILHDLSKPRCHLFITDGMVHFCGDCEHALAGKVVPMEAF